MKQRCSALITSGTSTRDCRKRQFQLLHSNFERKSSFKHESLNLSEIFQQHNAVELLENWPAQSPDLNIIQNVCCTLKQRVLKRHPKNIEDLWSACKMNLKENRCFPFENFTTRLRLD